jgi:hypothetical protein
MRVLSRSLAVFALGVACRLCLAQEVSTSAPAVATGTEVRLETHDGRTQFTLDEPIQLDLIFTSREPGYAVNNIDYGDVADVVSVTPAEGWFRPREKSGHDYVTSTELDNAPIRVPVLLNQAAVFQKPGHYEVSITTGRLQASTLTHGKRQTRPVPLQTTNAVGIDIVAPDEEQEAALVQSLSSQIAGEPGRARQTAALRLAYLSGDDAVRAKVHWLLSAEEMDNTKDHDNIGKLMGDGLASSRNQQLQLDLLEAAWLDPQRVPTSELQDALWQTRAFLRKQTIPGWVMGVAPVTDAAQVEAQKQAEQERQHDLSELVATLPSRSGTNRANTAYFLIETGKLSEADVAQVRPVVVEEFGRMDTLQQSMLLENRWTTIRDAALAPALREMLDTPAGEPMNSDTLQRLIEISPESASPYVVRAICDPKSDVPESYVGDLPEQTLPAADQCLATELRSWQGNNDLRFRAKVLLAARFGTKSLLPVVREVYAARSGKYPRQHDGPFLAYLLRYAPNEALPKIKTLSGSDAWIAFSDIDKVFAACHAPFPAELQAWFRVKAESSDKRDADWAAHELARFGNPDDKAIAEQQQEKGRP